MENATLIACKRNLTAAPNDQRIVTPNDQRRSYVLFLYAGIPSGIVLADHRYNYAMVLLKLIFY
jgi:hypothetical protein